MTSKYSLANEAIDTLNQRAAENGVEPDDAQEALMILVIQSLKATRGAAALKSLLQYEVDSLGSGGMHDLPRGGGHS